jgi:hypothetical protein
MIQGPHPGKQGWKVDDREHTTRAEGAQKAGVDRRCVRQMVVDTPQDDSKVKRSRSAPERSSSTTPRSCPSGFGRPVDPDDANNGRL